MKIAGDFSLPVASASVFVYAFAMDILLASGNTHKKKELEQIFKGHTILMPGDLGISFECEETGCTFMANALLKAQSLYAQARRPVLADDSGLCVDALDGAPGIYSARYGAKTGQNLSDKGRYELLLKNMEGIEKRTAHFVCAMVLILGNDRMFSVQETFEGSIAKSPHGKGGFGYDPVFIDAFSGRCAAELSEEEKNRVSHRGRAGRGMQALLEALS